MGTHHGKNGVAKSGNNVVAELQGWQIEEGVSTADDTAMGDSADTHLVGTTNWSGSLTCSYDETDTNGQEAFTVGSSVTLNLFPYGSGSGAHYRSGTATVTKVTMDAKKDGVVMRSFDFKGNGALSHTTI
jgi:hypothetical protein